MTQKRSFRVGYRHVLLRNSHVSVEKLLRFLNMPGPSRKERQKTGRAKLEKHIRRRLPPFAARQFLAVGLRTLENPNIL